jgi:signal transduction histidine kinase
VPFDADCRATASMNSPAAADAARWFAAHELRTPLQGIQGGIALLLEERGAGLSGVQLEALGLIAEASADLEQCIDHLAELAALGATPAPPPQKLALGALVAVPALGLVCGPKLASHATLDVLVVPQLASRALCHLRTLAEAGDAQLRGTAVGLGCELESVEEHAITLALALRPSASGDGAVVWHLAAALMQHAGGHLQPCTEATTRLTLRRAR